MKLNISPSKVVMYVALTTLLSMAPGVLSLRLGIMNDVHLNLTYNQGCTFPFCYDGGEYGFDSASTLVDTLLDDMKSNYDDPIDIFMLSGDFVMHGLAADNGGDGDWASMKNTISAVIDKVKSRFPNAMIIPTVGNNDVLHHYQAPTAADKAQYYSDLYDIWFANVPANAAYANIAGIETTFKNGGYYRYDINDKLSFLTLNTMYFSIKNN